MKLKLWFVLPISVLGYFFLSGSYFTPFWDAISGAETDAMMTPIKVAEWNKDGSLNKVINGRIRTINGIGRRAEEADCYAVSASEFNEQYVVVSRNPEIFTNGEWGCFLTKNEMGKDKEKFSFTNGFGSQTNVGKPVAFGFFNKYYSIWEGV